jgi:hypothetical protein
MNKRIYICYTVPITSGKKKPTEPHAQRGFVTTQLAYVLI